MTVTGIARTRRGRAAAALLAMQLLHLLDALGRPAPEAEAPAVGQAGHVVGLIVTIVALVAIRRRLSWAPLATAAAGAAVALGATVNHVLPLTTELNNTYWGRADALHWLVLLATVATGVWCFAAARADGAMRGRRDSNRAATPIT
jgi:hypothetical protein